MTKECTSRNASSEPDAEDEPAASGDTPIEREGEERTVMLIESSVSMQDTIRNALKKRGYRVLVFGDPQRALQRFDEHLEQEPLADCVIFSAGELGDDAVDAFNALGEAEATRSMPVDLAGQTNQQGTDSTCPGE